MNNEPRKLRDDTDEENDHVDLGFGAEHNSGSGTHRGLSSSALDTEGPKPLMPLSSSNSTAGDDDGTGVGDDIGGGGIGLGLGGHLGSIPYDLSGYAGLPHQGHHMHHAYAAPSHAHQMHHAHHMHMQHAAAMHHAHAAHAHAVHHGYAPMPPPPQSAPVHATRGSTASHAAALAGHSSSAATTGLIFDLDAAAEAARAAAAAATSATRVSKSGTVVQKTVVGKRTISSKYRGVSLTKSGHWRVQVGYRGHRISVGHFLDEEEASRAYDRTARALGFKVTMLNHPEVEYGPQHCTAETNELVATAIKTASGVTAARSRANSSGGGKGGGRSSLGKRPRSGSKGGHGKATSAGTAGGPPGLAASPQGSGGSGLSGAGDEEEEDEGFSGGDGGEEFEEDES